MTTYARINPVGLIWTRVLIIPTEQSRTKVRYFNDKRREEKMNIRHEYAIHQEAIKLRLKVIILFVDSVKLLRY